MEDYSLEQLLGYFMKCRRHAIHRLLQRIEFENQLYLSKMNNLRNSLPVDNDSKKRVAIPRMDKSSENYLLSNDVMLNDEQLRIRWYVYNPFRKAGTKRIEQEIQKTGGDKYTLARFKNHVRPELAELAFQHEKKLTQIRKLIDALRKSKAPYIEAEKIANTGATIDIEELSDFLNT